MSDIRRRAFITLLGGAAAWPLAARAQQGEKMRGVGVLMPGGLIGSTVRKNSGPATDAGATSLELTKGASI